MAQYYMLNKPRGLLTARRDARCETVMRCFPEALQQTLHPVGRLDKDTEGLLLLTDDGALAHDLLAPKSTSTRSTLSVPTARSTTPTVKPSSRASRSATGLNAFRQSLRF